MKLSLGALLLATVAVACGGQGGGSSVSEAEVNGTERGFAYECTTEKMFISAATTKVLVTPKHLSFDGDWGANVGALDATYRAPAGKKRVRFDGYETGEDCSMRVVADQALVDGQATGQVRIQCQGDDFQQEVLSCSKPKAATYRAPAAPPAPEPVVNVEPPADSKKWSCTTTDSSAFESELTMQITDAAIRIQEKDVDYDHTGTRDRDYHPRSGSWIAYDNVEYGGDCSISLVVDAKVLASGTSATTLKVRCAGDDFVEARYTCK